MIGSLTNGWQLQVITLISDILQHFARILLCQSSARFKYESQCMNRLTEGLEQSLRHAAASLDFVNVQVHFIDLVTFEYRAELFHAGNPPTILVSFIASVIHIDLH